jgi:hypothetical protein
MAAADAAIGFVLCWEPIVESNTVNRYRTAILTSPNVATWDGRLGGMRILSRRMDSVYPSGDTSLLSSEGSAGDKLAFACANDSKWCAAAIWLTTAIYLQKYNETIEHNFCGY